MYLLFFYVLPPIEMCKIALLHYFLSFEALSNDWLFIISSLSTIYSCKIVRYVSLCFLLYGPAFLTVLNSQCLFSLLLRLLIKTA